VFDQLIRFSLMHRLLVLAAAALISAYGVYAFNRLPVDVFPDLNRPTVTVMTEAPGMAPEEVETLVTLPLETVLHGLPGLQRLRSSSGIGLSIIYVEFDWDTDIYRNRQLISERLLLAQNRLPHDVAPMMGPIASIMGEVQLIALTSPEGTQSPTELRTLADWSIRPRLLTVPGVAQVIAIGGGVKQYQILISAEKLQRFQLPLDEVRARLSVISQNTTGGYIDLSGREYLIRNLGRIEKIEDLMNSVVGLHFGRQVLVRDIAEVKEGIQVKRGDGSANAKPAVIISIQKQPEANTLELEANVDRALDEIQTAMPKGVVINRELFRQSQFIRAAISNIEEALRDGAILVAVVLFLFLMSFRTTVITLVTIPLSLLVAAIVFHRMGLSVNTMTLGGIAIAIGELVDDAIVDVENVFRRLKENRLMAQPQPVLKVVFDASREIRNSIVFATIITILVFIPLFFLGGIEGRMFMPLGVAYIISLLASLVVALTVTPVLCSYLLVNKKSKSETDGLFVRILKNLDRRQLEWSLDHPRLVVFGALVLFVFAVALSFGFGREFLPQFNEGTATVNVIARPGISLEASNALGQKAEEILLSVQEVKSVARRTGRAEADEHAEGVHYSEIDVDFKPTDRPRSEVMAEVRKQLEQLEGVSVSVGQPISHRLDHLLSGVRAEVAIKIFGPELSTLRLQAAELRKELESVGGLVDLQVEQQALIPQVKIRLLREEAARFGIVLGELAEILETALNGEVVAQTLERQRVFNVFMRFDDQSRTNLDAIKETVIKIMPDGRRVYLRDVADIYEATGPNIIQRENAVRRIVVQANVSGRDLDSVIKDVRGVLAQRKLPDGYFVQIGGQFESQQQASRLLLLLGFASFIAIFIVLYAHFKSAFVAIQVMINIPLAFIGGVIAIWFADKTLSIASLIAFITLAGIASRNGIMMISHYLHLMRHEGESFTRAMVIRGSLERLVPVLMTALTAILALLPLIVFGAEQAGKEILYPVAVVIVGGLLSSTLLDMIVTPTVFYNYGRRSAERLMLKNEEEL